MLSIKNFKLKWLLFSALIATCSDRGSFVEHTRQPDNSDQHAIDSSRPESTELEEAVLSKNKGIDASCLQEKDLKYHFQLLLDGSASQKNTDPDPDGDGPLLPMRAQAALEFVRRFAAVNKAPGVELFFSVLKFNASTQPYMNERWTLLSDEASRQSIEQEVRIAASNPVDTTLYGAAFAGAARLFSRTPLKTSVSMPKHRNFIIFMTDGMPEDGKDFKTNFNNLQLAYSLYYPRARELASRYGVAFYSIAVGSKLTTADESVVKALAIPEASMTVPGHKGKFFRARAVEDLLGVWDQVFEEIANKCP